MDGLLIGYARCSTRGQDLRAQEHELRKAGVAEGRIYTDAGFTGRNTNRPGLTTALAVVREGDTLIVTKLDRLGRSIVDLHRIANELTAKGVKLSWGGTTYNPLDPAGKLFFSMLAAFAELSPTSFGLELGTESRRLGAKVGCLVDLRNSNRCNSGGSTTISSQASTPWLS